MKTTILYDNETAVDSLVADWGFSCLIETDGKKILFDTGAKGDILFRNMTLPGIDPSDGAHGRIARVRCLWINPKYGPDLPHTLHPVSGGD